MEQDLGFFTSYIRVTDIFLAGMIVYGAYKGFRRGFLLEIISTVVFVVGAALIFFGVAGAFSSSKTYFETPKSTVFFAYVVLFFGGTMGLNLLGKWLQDKIDYSVLDDLDNVAALLLGGFKYALSLSVILGLFNSAGLGLPKEVTEDSVVYPKLLELNDWVLDAGGTIMPSMKRYSKEIHELFEENL
ncbi:MULTISPECIES: CvpA family protein [Flammeovirga]|uniref:CvpA family protein n=1 Tax=Flammeovirga agarivorans TaxID=2726742 RepID=A0A7X8SIN7_9BACT|nr:MULTISPECIES: CvpA family protein [Flammeovirga]NLR90940.1 CvpA family protein [Flammeovirga agarivorans]